MLQEEALHPEKIEPVDVLLSCLCVEAAAQDFKEYSEVVKRLTDRYLKPGGKLILLAACEDTFWQFGGKSYHCCVMTREGLLGMVRDKLGFTAVEMREGGFGEAAFQTSDVSDAAGFVLIKATKPFWFLPFSFKILVMGMSSVN